MVSLSFLAITWPERRINTTRLLAGAPKRTHTHRHWFAVGCPRVPGHTSLATGCTCLSEEPQCLLCYYLVSGYQGLARPGCKYVTLPRGERCPLARCVLTAQAKGSTGEPRRAAGASCRLARTLICSVRGSLVLNDATVITQIGARYAASQIVPPLTT